MFVDTIAPGHLKTEDEHRRELCLAGRWLYERGFVPATDGNLSVRLDHNRILISPSNHCKGMLRPDALAITDLKGEMLAGRGGPSSEIGMHLAIFQRRSDVNAICHAHPPTATGFAAAGKALDKPLLTEVIMTLGAVPLAGYAMPGTHEVADALTPLIDKHDAVLLSNHGVVTYGPDLLTAFFRMETVEQLAKITLVTEMLGKQSLLSGGDVEKLLAGRAYSSSSSRGSAQHGGTQSDSAGTRGSQQGEARVTLTRQELEELIEEALRRDRARR
jgi:L-fuculose-phosphate aldolase